MAKPAKKPAKRKTKEPARPPGLALIAGYDPTLNADGCWFDPEAAAMAVDFFPECLHHIEGATAGQPFVLEPWQQNIIACLFGWKRKDNKGRVVRRYRECLMLIPRKNGKSPLVAGIGLFLLFCDGEIGAQVYCAAAEKEQASIIFKHAKGMVEREPELDERCTIYGGAGHRSIVLKDDEASVLKVLSADADTKHGGNSHGILFDELHAQPNRDLVDVLQTSTASETRAQPLSVYITTSDFDRVSICNEKVDYAHKVRDGIIIDPAFLPVVYEATNKDDWRKESTWAKANPNLGVSVSLDYMRRECQRAQETPIYENTFKRLHLNIRTAQDVRLIVMEDWDKCPGQLIDPAELAEEECFAGLDLASTTDLASLVLWFPRIKYLLPHFWCPSDNAEARERRDRVPYQLWAKQGFITLTPGNVIDYNYIIARIVAMKSQFRGLRQVGYDPWNARQTAIKLQDEYGVEMVEFRQGFISMNEPTKELLRLIAGHELNHGNNPVMRWMASNASGKTDPADNIKIDKKTSREKVDGLVAGVMGIGLSLVRQAEGPSIYEQPGAGVLVL